MHINDKCKHRTVTIIKQMHWYSFACIHGIALFKQQESQLYNSYEQKVKYFIFFAIIANAFTNSSHS